MEPTTMLAAHLGRQLAPYVWRTVTLAAVVLACLGLALLFTLAGAATSGSHDQDSQPNRCGRHRVHRARLGRRWWCCGGLTVDGVALDGEQLANAGVIAATGGQVGIPQRGVVVALATAAQESRLHNLDYGDADSVGLFQQRPSQGWGQVTDLLRPDYAATRFFEALQRVPGWEPLPVTQAAQAVQRSAFPSAYARWESLAAALAGIPGVRDAACAVVAAAGSLFTDAAGPGGSCSSQPAHRGGGDRLGPGAGRHRVGGLVSAVFGVRGAGVRVGVLRHRVCDRPVPGGDAHRAAS